MLTNLNFNNLYKIRTSQYNTAFQLTNRLSIVHFIKRQQHYEVLLDYAG